MDSYTVKYKLKEDWFWTTIKNVIGDGITSRLVDSGEFINLPEPFRFFTTIDNKMIHIPYQAQVIFSKERDIIISKRMSKQAGQQIQRN